jgi:3-oxoacyl-[acyl-carrier protein] reductase
VILTYHNSKQSAETLLASLPGTGHLALQTRVDETPTVQELAERVQSQHGKLDVLVNCAGTTRFVPHHDLDALDDNLIDEIFRINWRGVFACVRAFRSLLERGSDPLVINISSIAAVSGMGSNVAYCASKAALDSMTRSLARALAPTIRVVSLSPGVVDTEFIRGLDPSWREDQLRHTPLQRFPSPEEIGEAVVALVTTLTSMTGCILPLDGGRPLG